jgi:uncharacterized sulfatase
LKANAFGLVRIALVVLLSTFFISAAPLPTRLPNILWITSEDNGPQLGAYGDAFAVTPNLDRLAHRGMIYTNAWSNAPVCAPARTSIISGVYPTSLGAQHMRSLVEMPSGMRMYPQFLREVGYYCTNNSKEDYNLVKPGEIWDESSSKAHFRNRPDGRPFFSIFNITTTHESQIRKRPHTPVHDPLKVRVPAYHPDTPEVRQAWAQYYDKMTEMDTEAGAILAQLQEDGLAEDTIVFYYGDHGPGMPRSKRYPYNSGLLVPMIVYIPEKYADLAPSDYTAGGSSSRPVAFVDLAPTVLSLAGIDPPDYMQGDAFLGPYAQAPRAFNFGFRGRMDERIDMTRSVRDDRYVYLRNYNPHKIYGQYVDYMFQTPTTQVWHQLFLQGKLAPAQSRFWETKPYEELYDLETDPDETVNLIGRPELQAEADRLRSALDQHLEQVRDLGFLPEAEFHKRSAGKPPGELARDNTAYPLQEIKAVADLAASGRGGADRELKQATVHPDSAVRYWGSLGFLIRGKESVEANRETLLRLLDDPSEVVKITAAEALGRYGTDEDVAKALDVLMSYADPAKNGVYVGVMALNAIDYMDERAESVREAIGNLADSDPSADQRLKNYPLRLREKILADLD